MSAASTPDIRKLDGAPRDAAWLIPEIKNGLQMIVTKLWLCGGYPQGTLFPQSISQGCNTPGRAAPALASVFSQCGISWRITSFCALWRSRIPDSAMNVKPWARRLVCWSCLVSDGPNPCELSHAHRLDSDVHLLDISVQGRRLDSISGTCSICVGQRCPLIGHFWSRSLAVSVGNQ